MTSQSDLSFWQSRVESIPNGATLRAKWIASNILRLVEDRSVDESEKLQLVLTAVLDFKRGKTLAASEATLKDLRTLFQLDFDVRRMQMKPWELRAEPYDMPQKLKDNLHDLSRALYDEDSKATCRVAVDMMLIACKLHLIDHCPEDSTSKKRKTASCPSTPQLSDPREVVRVFPELDVHIDVMHPGTKQTIRVTGRADWGFGYGERDGAQHGTFLVAVEAKRRELFSTAETQLLTYMAILREQRKRAGKKNTTIQGFYTDGYRYCFMSIDNEGVVEESPQYYVTSPQGGKTIFNFIVTILESAMKSSPNVSPTKDAREQENEITNYREEVWSKVYLTTPETVPKEEEELWDLPDIQLRK
ncbi:hypothetical protein FGG08_003804 [Glutinoglossum americanum]|uniref:Uncharacterized protein n=1 Tax=Glutinoglossum americanum TaxID=1670608 RepID=A0A9P8I8T1_9PEZI|nr:hypothetical protein FGG08_003804 [Glutinoglossum americanum]